MNRVIMGAQTDPTACIPAALSAPVGEALDHAPCDMQACETSAACLSRSRQSCHHTRQRCAQQAIAGAPCSQVQPGCPTCTLSCR